MKNPEDVKMVNDIMSTMNRMFTKLVDPKDDKCYKGDDFVEDTKIRFKLNEVIEWKDDYFANLDNGGSCPNESSWYLNKLDSVIFSNPKYERAINIYFPNSFESHDYLHSGKDSVEFGYTKPACSQLPSKRKLVRSSKVCQPNSHNKIFWMKNYAIKDPKINKKGLKWEGGMYHWFIAPLAEGLAHELGHSMGLMHGNEHHGRNRCSVSIMNQSHTSARNYLPPTEIGKMHRCMRMTNIREFLTEEVYSPIPWVIEEDVDMDIDYKVYEDIIVKSGKTLKVTCNLQMSPKTTIYLEEGATLDLTEGTITPVRNLNWNGVIMQKAKGCGKKKKAFPAPEIRNKNNISGQLFIKSGKIAK